MPLLVCTRTQPAWRVYQLSCIQCRKCGHERSSTWTNCTHQIQVCQGTVTVDHATCILHDFLSTGVTSLTPFVSVAVLGLFSSYDQVTPEQFIYDKGDKRLNFITTHGRKEVFDYIIEHFSLPNSLVLDLTHRR